MADDCDFQTIVISCHFYVSQGSFMVGQVSFMVDRGSFRDHLLVRSQSSENHNRPRHVGRQREVPPT